MLGLQWLRLVTVPDIRNETAEFVAQVATQGSPNKLSSRRNPEALQRFCESRMVEQPCGVGRSEAVN